MCDSCGYPGSDHYALGLSYPADRNDGHHEFMKSQTVQKAAWDFLRTGSQIGLHHLDGTVGHAQVVESYIYRGPDWVTTAADGTTQVIKAGDWMLGVQFDAATWPLVMSGQVNGWSIQGVGRRRKPGEGT